MRADAARVIGWTRERLNAEQIAFLDDLPPDERARRTPGAQSGGFQQIAALSQPAPGVWQLRVSKGDRVLTARAGEPLVYPARAVRAAQDWLRVPVAGIDWMWFAIVSTTSIASHYFLIMAYKRLDAIQIQPSGSKAAAARPWRRPCRRAPCRRA